jgi:hypothetical protein
VRIQRNSCILSLQRRFKVTVRLFVGRICDHGLAALQELVHQVVPMKRFWLSLLLTTASSCSEGGARSPAPIEEQVPTPAAKANPLALRDATPNAADGAASGSVATPADSAGWQAFSREDDVPLCMLATYQDWGEAQFIKDVKPKVSLKAGRELQFAIYAPGCAGRDCTRRVNLQCWADVAGMSITVHARYNGEHNPKNTCTKDCEADTAACNTPALRAGTYAVTYGVHQYSVRIPSVTPSCLLR